MSDFPKDDKPGFVAERPEHCFACYRVIRPGEIRRLVNALAEARARLADLRSQEE